MWIPPEKWPQKFDLKVVCVDASKGKNDKQGDFSAIVFMGVGADRLLYVDAIIDRIVAQFHTLPRIMGAPIAELEKVGGVGEAKARTVRDGLARLVEASILERYE